MFYSTAIATRFLCARDDFKEMLGVDIKGNGEEADTVKASSIAGGVEPGIHLGSLSDSGIKHTSA
jgi:hypothetical protein